MNLTTNGPTQSQLHGHLQRADLNAIWRYMPLTVNQDAREWLKNGLVKGLVKEVSFNIDGDLQQFPFASEQVGKFTVNAKVVDAQVNFNHKWPVIDNVAGVVQAKDILDRVLDGKEFSLAAALRQPIAIPDSVSALEALERLKTDMLGIAIVLDEYGSFEGMVTAADVLEAIVGDADDAGPKEGAPETPDDMFEFDGLMPVDETKARLHLPDLPNEGSYHTLGGLILALLMRLPRQGDAILFGGWRFEVLVMDGRRIERVRVERDSS
ncbi:MAG: hypothetical protein B7Z81_11150 [Acidocella sp. 20-61-6]|nr:MAG: hypothetical protein B7Z81_11150 [Acidocella sp. 20-61-6]